MKYRRLGKTGLQVSEIGFGGEWLCKLPKEEAVSLIKEAHHHGVNIIDCWMADPLSRNYIGEGIKEDRAGWYVQGQIGSTYINGQYQKSRKLPEVKAAFEDLLQRMQTDYMDLGVIHYCDLQEDWDELMNGPFIEYVKDLKQKGIIKHIGLSTHSVNIGRQAVDSGLIEMILFSINAAFDLMPVSKDLDAMFEMENYESVNGPDQERADFYRYCEEHDVGLTVMKPFEGGRLLDAKRSPFGVAMTPVQAIHYVLTRPAVASAMIGYENSDHLKAALAYETANDEEKNYAKVIANAPLRAYQGTCTYCGHCQPCAVGIDIATVSKFYDLASVHEEVPDSIRKHYQELPLRARDCIGCQACEANCPFGVKIAERMQKIAELLD